MAKIEVNGTVYDVEMQREIPKIKKTLPLLRPPRQNRLRKPNGARECFGKASERQGSPARSH
jgi:hypothetical protein